MGRQYQGSPPISLAVNGKPLARATKSGTARVVEQLVGHIARLRPDLEVEVFVPVPAGGRLLDLDWPEQVRIHTSRSPLHGTSWGRSLWEQVVLPWKVRRRGRADLLLDLSNSAPVLVSPGVPQVVLVHDTGFRRRAWVSRSFSAYLDLILSHLEPESTHATSGSKDAAAQVERAFPHLAPVVSIPNAATTPPRNLAPARREAPYALVLGALNPRKNIAGAIEAFRIFRERAAMPARLVVAGPSDAIYRSTREPSGGKNVQVPGYVSDEEKWRLIAGARLLLLPSFMEGFGLPILEALTVGTPVVASDLPVFRELYGDAVEYVDPTSAEDIARGIERVFSDDDRRRELIERGDRVARRYSWDRSAREYLDLMDEIVASEPAAGRTTPEAVRPSPGGTP